GDTAGLGGGQEERQIDIGHINEVKHGSTRCQDFAGFSDAILDTAAARRLEIAFVDVGFDSDDGGLGGLDNGGGFDDLGLSGDDARLGGGDLGLGGGDGCFGALEGGFGIIGFMGG